MEKEILEKLTKIDNRLDSIEARHINMLPDAIRFKEACQITGLSESQMYKNTSLGIVPHYHQGKFLYFSRKELTAWMLAHPVKTLEEIECETETRTAVKRGRPRS
jgi:predicted DNA-binding transcriptional regulator AlpA